MTQFNFCGGGGVKWKINKKAALEELNLWAACVSGVFEKRRKADEAKEIPP